MRLGFSLLVLAALVAVAGCGGSSVSSGSSAAEVAGLLPASAPLLVELETDPESEQWRQADELLSRFPGRDTLLDEFRDELADEDLDFEEDVLPALGDRTYFAFLDFEDDGDNFVLVTKPRDRAKLERLLDESDEPTVTREVDGWTVAARSEAVLDRLAAGERLEAAGWFQDAQERVEGDALATLYANGAAIQDALRESLPEGCELPEAVGRLDYATATLAAEDDGVAFRLAAVGEGIQELVEGDSLFSSVPGGVFAYLGSPGFDSSLFSLDEQLRCAADSEDVPDVERELGVSADDVLDLFAGGFALYARGGAIVPEVTVLLSPEDEERAVATLDDLAEKVALFGELDVEQRKVGDVDARALNFGPVTVLYGAGDGKLVVTTNERGFDALTRDGGGLEDDDDFRAAREAAGVADGDEVFVYLDLHELVDIAQALAGFSGDDLPEDVKANLEPLESFLAWGDLGDPDDVELGAFLTIR